MASTATAAKVALESAAPARRRGVDRWQFWGRVLVLPYVLVAIVTVTFLRSIFLYLQTVETSRIVMRLSTDMQQMALEHLMWSDLARLTRDTPGRLVSKLTNDISFIQTAATAALNTAVRDTLSVIALAGSMFYLDWVMSLTPEWYFATIWCFCTSIATVDPVSSTFVKNSPRSLSTA